MLTNQQKDALAELINIGFGRAASALSIMVNQRVILETPEVNIYPLDRLPSVLTTLSQGDITSVHQVFTGTIAGNAMLLMDVPSATILVDLLNGGPGESHELTEADREALQETGNILLNAFTGSFGNMLQVHISFAVPHLQYDSLRNMLSSLTIDQRTVEYAMVVRVTFSLLKGGVSGYVVIVMGIQSLDALLDAMRAVGYIQD